MIGTIFSLLGALGVFLYGMRVMSDGIQKVAGNKLQNVLNFMTQNRVAAVFTGFLITALVQSSSATTVMIVSFVNAALLNLSQAIGLIMGANIGTTVTTWIVSFFGFKFKITAMALPIIGVGLPFIFSKIKKRRDFGEVLIGFGILFLGLMFLKESVPDIKHHPEILEFLKHYTGHGILSYFIFVFVGTILTIIVQSSSAAMAITVVMAAKGWIGFETAAAIVLGENIGTTVTAYLASLGTSVNARRAARAHFLFNTFGVIWMTFVFYFFARMIVNISPWDTTGFITSTGASAATEASIKNMPLSLSLFHTIFNIMNTLIFLAFIPQLAKLVEKLVKSKEGEISGEYKLKYISTGIQDTPQLNILHAKKEITEMAKVTEQMFQSFLEIFKNPNKKLEDKVEELATMENLTDQMQSEITRYLADCSKEELSERSVMNVSAMVRIINELENIGDACYKLGLLTQRKYDNNIEFHEKATEEFSDFANLIQEFMDMYKENMNEHLEDRLMQLAYKMEDKIDHLRDNLKKAAQQRMQEGADVNTELLYIDFIKYFEHIGDNSLNITQALKQVY